MSDTDETTPSIRADRQLVCGECDTTVEPVPVAGEPGGIGLSLLCDCSEVPLNMEGVSLRRPSPESWGVDDD